MRKLAFALFAVGLVGLATPAPSRPLALVYDADAFTPKATPDGATCDLPNEEHLENSLGRDRKGLCVFTSVEVCARWQNVRELDGFRDWMKKRPGGGWPEKLAAMIKAFCKAKKVPVPQYVQHTGGDLAFLDLALKTRRMAAVTYAGVDDYYDFPIAHMINLVHLDGQRACVIDNNRLGVWLWMTRDEFAARWLGNHGGWAVVLLAPPPPPAPAVVGNQESGVRSQESGTGRGTGTGTPAPPIGEPPTADHYWGWIEGAGWGWKLMDNFGLDLAKIPGGAPRYWVNDEECSRAEAFAAVAGEGAAEGSDLIDDSDRYHLSIVADEFTATGLTARLGDRRIACFNPRCHMQVYRPDSWVARTRLTAKASLHEPASKGGRLVGTTNDLSTDGLLALLEPVLNPKPAPAPAPHVPAPAPEPCPCPSPCPCPTPSPSPSPSPRAPCGPQPDVWVSALAALAAWLAKKK